MKMQNIARNGKKKFSIELQIIPFIYHFWQQHACNHLLPFLATSVIKQVVAIFGNYAQKWPKMAIFIDLKVAKNGNYLLYDRSCQKWLHIIAKNGNERNDLQLYKELKSLFCHFWQYFASLSCQKFAYDRSCQKWQ